MKRISKENLGESDLFPSTLTEETWINFILRTELNSNVPEALDTMFRVMQGAMIYGLFFYPLVTLAAEQSFHILELSARKRCEQLKIPLIKKLNSGQSMNRTFSELIEDLTKRGEISLSDRKRWEGGRSLRNAVSHPSGPTLLTHGNAISILEITAELINKLYKL